MTDEQRGDEVRLVAMKKSTCRELLNASEMWGGGATSFIPPDPHEVREAEGQRESS